MVLEVIVEEVEKPSVSVSPFLEGPKYSKENECARWNGNYCSATFAQVLVSCMAIHYASQRIEDKGNAMFGPVWSHAKKKGEQYASRMRFEPMRLYDDNGGE